MIRPRSTRFSLDPAALWAHRELLYFLVWRDVKVRYKQTVLGASWAIIQPVVAMVVFSVFFGRLAGVPSDGVPYPIFALTALVPWTYFSNALTGASNSLVASQALLQKVYFPRLVIPVAAVLSGLVDFLLAFAVLIALMFVFGIPLTPAIVWTVPLLALTIATATAFGLWFSALNVRYRDVRFLVPFLVQVWLFATPIAYPSSLLDEPWRTIYALNPMVGVVEGFRWALLGTNTAPGVQVLLGALVTVVVLGSGIYYFRRTEASFADIV